MREVGHTGVIRGADSDVLAMYCEAVVRYRQGGRAPAPDGAAPRRPPPRRLRGQEPAPPDRARQRGPRAGPRGRARAHPGRASRTPRCRRGRLRSRARSSSCGPATPRAARGWPPRWLTPVPAADVRRGDGDGVLDFIDAYASITKDSVAGLTGEPLVARPWQRQLIRHIFARTPDGRRRHRIALVGHGPQERQDGAHGRGGPVRPPRRGRGRAGLFLRRGPRAGAPPVRRREADGRAPSGAAPGLPHLPRHDRGEGDGLGVSGPLVRGVHEGGPQPDPRPVRRAARGPHPRSSSTSWPSPRAPGSIP